MLLCAMTFIELQENFPDNETIITHFRTNKNEIYKEVADLITPEQEKEFFVLCELKRDLFFDIINQYYPHI